MPAATNAREWQRVLDLYGRARRNKTEPEIINRAAGNSCWKAMRKTKKARLGQFPLNATANPEKGGKTFKQKIYFALATKGGTKKGEGVLDEANERYRKRRGASGAIAAGFINAIRAFGRNITARPLRGGRKPGGSVSRSSGHPVRGGRGKMEGRAINRVDGAGVIAKPAMDMAVREVTRDMEHWAIKKLQETDNRFSARRF